MKTCPHLFIATQMLRAKLLASHSIDAAAGGGCAAGSFSYGTANATQYATIATRGVMQAVLDGAAASNEPLLIRLCPGTSVYLTVPLRIDSRSFVGIECAAVTAGGSHEPRSSSSTADNVWDEARGRMCVLGTEDFGGPLVRVTSSEAVVSFNSLGFKARVFVPFIAPDLTQPEQRTSPSGGAVVAEAGALVFKPDCQELTFWDEDLLEVAPLVVDVARPAVAATIPDGRDARALPIPMGPTTENMDDYFQLELTYFSEVRCILAPSPSLKRALTDASRRRYCAPSCLRRTPSTPPQAAAARLAPFRTAPLWSRSTRRSRRAV